ncbi:hypothetical protein LOD99_6683 [Oopsacas minuta]|uniref:Uncharacterized protein n=1 Tax=Oopsacas minuta TaxID=111878 RepID=A0AAV7JLF8_9METZ|nr:hypothetical protein LOD99_6683 [Oopsacas minuta]
MTTANTLERIFSVGKKSKIQPIVSVYNSTGDIYVADCENNCLKVFDCNGKIMFKFGDEEGEGKMYRPNGLAICRDRILISHRNDCILNYQLNGKFISRIGKPGKGELEFDYPLGLTFDESSRELTYKTQFGQDYLESPLDVKLTKEFIYILDRSNPCLHLYNYNLILHKSIISRGDGLEQNNPNFFCIDNSNNILITDFTSRYIFIFNSQFYLIHKIFIDYSTGITVDNRGRVIIVCEGSKHCLNIF